VETFQPEPFGKYWLVDRIATGGMAEIFKAVSFSHGGFSNLVVIKRILPHLGEEATFVDLFIAEAKVTVALQHPNIVRVFDFGREDPHFFISMEHVDGRDLRRALVQAARSGRRLPTRLAVYIALQACKGLHHAHTRTTPEGKPLAVVHRDISPSNLLLSYDGQVKVADFGVARNLAADEEGGLKGKYQYMAPEQARGEAVDARTDLFALGIVLYELVTGARAFKGADDTETLRKVVAVELAPVLSAAPGLSPRVAAVIDTLLQRDPADRYGSGREAEEALRGALDRPEHEAQAELAAWLQELFADDRSEEQRRLEAGTSAARELNEAAVELEDEPAPPPPTQGRLVGLLAAAVFGALLLLGGALWTSGIEVQPPAVQVAATGSLQFDLTPAAKVFISGRPAGEGAAVVVEGLAPGDYDVRVEADGHQALVETVAVTRGGATRVRRTLEPLAANAPVVAFSTRPQGASVLVDGKVVGKTPLEWKDGAPGGSYVVELRLDGFQTMSGTLAGLTAAKRTSYARNLEPVGGAKPVDPKVDARADPKPADPKPAAAAGGSGTLKVVLLGANWAQVYIDGKKVEKSAPFSGVSLSAGEHLIKVENPAAGLSHVQKVTVTAGGSVTVRAAVQ
jgi:hypothetical protein